MSGAATLTEQTLRVRNLLALPVDTRVEGADAAWLAPVACFTSQHGFGEETWCDSLPVSALAVRLSGAPIRCMFEPHQGRVLEDDGALTFQVKGTPSRYFSRGPISWAEIFLPDTLLTRVSEDLCDEKLHAAPLRDDLVFFYDRDLRSLVAQYLSRALASTVSPSRLEMEARSLLMIEHLIRRHHASGPASMRPVGGLAGWQIRRVTEYLRERLADDVSLAELSQLVGLSPRHLCTAFRQSTGLPPHRWQIERRVERAKEMLANPAHSITDVALACGFGSSAHFATMFRRAVGQTPRDWRRRRA